MSDDLQVRWLGRIKFEDAFALQEELVAKKRGNHSLGDELLLLEHEPVYTIGRTPDRSSLRGASHLPHPLFPINRGGQATYHGPGQLVGYPIIDLRRCGQDLHRYLRWIEAVLIELLDAHGIAATTRKGLTGVWVGDRKIASIGVGVRHWITMHGFALNVCGDLSPFDQITPCGIANVTMTSMEKESDVPYSVQDVAERCAKLLGSARILRAGDDVPSSRTSLRYYKEELAFGLSATLFEVRCGDTPQPARETRALPGKILAALFGSQHLES